MSDAPPSLARSAGVVGGLAAASRVLGMARDQMIAARLGAGLEASAFVIAFTVPNLLRRLFGEGALSASILPRLVRLRQARGDAAAWSLARSVALRLALVMSVAAAAGFLLARLLPAVFPALGAQARLLLRLSEIMLPYAVCIVVAAVAMGALQARGRFAAPAGAPLLLNLVLIATLLFACPRWARDPAAQAMALAVAVAVAGVLQVALQLPSLRAEGWRWRPGVEADKAAVRPEARAALRALVPAAAAAAVTQVNLLVDRLMAAFAGPQAPAALYFSERLVYLPLGIFAVAAAQVLLPALSHLAARDEAERIRQTCARSTAMLAFLVLPAAAGLAVLALPITRLIYGFGAFDAASVRATAIALAAYAPALLVFSLEKVFVPVFQARHETRLPLLAGLGSVLLNGALNGLCLIALPAAWAPAGIALSTVFAQSLYIGVLAMGLHRRLGGLPWGVMGAALARCAAASSVMAAAAVGVFALLDGWVPASKAGQAVSTLGAVAAGMGVYFGLAAIFRFPELRQMLAHLIGRERPADPG